MLAEYALGGSPTDERSTLRRLTDVFLLRRPLWLARGAALDEKSVATVRIARVLVPIAGLLILALVVFEDGKVGLRLFLFAMCACVVPFWLYMTTMIRGYGMRDSIEPAEMGDRFTSSSVHMLQDQLDGFSLMIKVVFWAMLISSLLAAPAWLGWL